MDVNLRTSNRHAVVIGARGPASVPIALQPIRCTQMDPGCVVAWLSEILFAVIMRLRMLSPPSFFSIVCTRPTSPLLLQPRVPPLLDLRGTSILLRLLRCSHLRASITAEPQSDPSSARPPEKTGYCVNVFGGSFFHNQHHTDNSLSACASSAAYANSNAAARPPAPTACALKM